jgi:hypothetical protein
MYALSKPTVLSVVWILCRKPFQSLSHKMKYYRLIIFLEVIVLFDVFDNSKQIL